MKELGRYILTWILGLFNVGVYAGDGLDSLFIEYPHVTIEEEIAKTYELLLMVESIKVALMCLTVIFLILANEMAIKRIGRWICSKSKQAFNFTKKTIKKLFKPKH